MESIHEPSLEELTVVFDLLTREYAAANDEHRQTEIATEISELTAHISTITSRSSR
jgi:hypothetical protein